MIVPDQEAFGSVEITAEEVRGWKPDALSILLLALEPNMVTYEEPNEA